MINLTDTDGGYELVDQLAVTQRQLTDANAAAARAIAQTVHAQRTIDALRTRCRDLEDAVQALEGPAEAPAPEPARSRKAAGRAPG